jgi:hypothetical protein
VITITHIHPDPTLPCPITLTVLDRQYGVIRMDNLRVAYLFGHQAVEWLEQFGALRHPTTSG